jgi:hypothetical protein
MTTSRASRWNRPEPKPDSDPYTKRRMLKGGAIVGCVFCIASLCATVFLTLMQHDLLARGEAAVATVVSIRPGNPLARSKPMIRFVTSTGIPVETECPEVSGSAPPRVGESVRILYDPANPKQVTLPTWSEVAPTLLLTGGFTVAWGFAFVVSFRGMRAIPRRAPNDGTRRWNKVSAGAPLTPASKAAPPALPDR